MKILPLTDDCVSWTSWAVILLPCDFNKVMEFEDYLGNLLTRMSLEILITSKMNKKQFCL